MASKLPLMTPPTAANSSIRRTRDYSKTGCTICRVKKKKCDEKKPVCSFCQRNAHACSWPQRYSPQAAASQVQAVHDLDDLSASAASLTLTAVERQHAYPLAMDRPRTVKGSTSMTLGSGQQVTAMQYLIEAGHQISRHSLPDGAEFQNFNMYKLGLPLALANQGHLEAFLAISLAHLGRQTSSDQPEAVRFYQISVKKMQTDLMALGDEVPDELLCMTSLSFAWYEMIMYSNVPAQKAHIEGFHRLWLARFKRNAPSAFPTQWPVELYAYCIAARALIVPSLTHLQYDTDHIEREIYPRLGITDDSQGRFLCGISPGLISAAYKLACLRREALRGTDVSAALIALLNKLGQWQMPALLETPGFREMHLVNAMYYAACLCLGEHLAYPARRQQSDTCSRAFTAVIALLDRHQTWPRAPPCSLGWPILILGCAAEEERHQKLLLKPLLLMIWHFGASGMMSLVEIVRRARSFPSGGAEGPGLGVLDRDEDIEKLYM